jgi:hypothetical protein
MKFIENFKTSREVKQHTLDELDAQILSSTDAEEISKLMDIRRKIRLNDIDAGDILKVVANVAVVAVIVGFEVRNIMSQKGSRFIKVL